MCPLLPALERSRPSPMLRPPACASPCSRLETTASVRNRRRAGKSVAAFELMREIDDFTSAVTGLAASQRAAAKQHRRNPRRGTSGDTAYNELYGRQSVGGGGVRGGNSAQWRGTVGVHSDRPGRRAQHAAGAGCVVVRAARRARPDRAEASRAEQPTVVAEERGPSVLLLPPEQLAVLTMLHGSAVVDPGPSMAAAESLVALVERRVTRGGARSLRAEAARWWHLASRRGESDGGGEEAKEALKAKLGRGAAAAEAEAAAAAAAAAAEAEVAQREIAERAQMAEVAAAAARLEALEQRWLLTPSSARSRRRLRA